VFGRGGKKWTISLSTWLKRVYREGSLGKKGRITKGWVTLWGWSGPRRHGRKKGTLSKRGSKGRGEYRFFQFQVTAPGDGAAQT